MGESDAFCVRLFFCSLAFSNVQRISPSFRQGKFSIRRACLPAGRAKNVGDASRRRGFLTKYNTKFDSLNGEVIF